MSFMSARSQFMDDNSNVVDCCFTKQTPRVREVIEQKCYTTLENTGLLQKASENISKADSSQSTKGKWNLANNEKDSFNHELNTHETVSTTLRSQISSENEHIEWTCTDNNSQLDQLRRKRSCEIGSDQEISKRQKQNHAINQINMPSPLPSPIYTKQSQEFSVTPQNKNPFPPNAYGQWIPNQAMCTPNPSPTQHQMYHQSNHFPWRPPWSPLSAANPSNSWNNRHQWRPNMTGENWQLQPVALQNCNNPQPCVRFSNQPRSSFAYKDEYSNHHHVSRTSNKVRNPTFQPTKQQQYVRSRVMIEDEQNGPIRFPPTPTSPEPLLHLTTNNYTPRFNAKPNPFEDKTFFLGEQCSNPMALNAWTASNNFVKQFLPSSVSPNDVFCLVPGRLGIPNVGKRHEVLVGEILRRVLTPESLNISLLGPILRKAKSRNGSQYLREKLSEIGVLLPQGRRKTAQCTLFTSLTESEANQLCNDFGKLCHYNFPSRPLALCAQERHREETENGYDLVVVDKAIQMVDEFIQLITPSTSHFPSNGVKQEKRVDEAIYTELYNFDTLTHGFGINTINHVMSTFKNYLNCLKEFR